MSRTVILESIEKKIAKLIADNRKLRDEKEKLAVSRDKLRDENRQLVDKVAELERRLTVMELREGFGGETADSKSTKAARARVNRLMREVDKCIMLLNKGVD